MNKIIDFASINQDDFVLSERGDFVLITPRKSKHVWAEEELHLRSLLCRKDTGEVVSAGFPKFFNFGENNRHDAEFIAAMKRGAVTFSQKLDGSLIILSAATKDKPHFRTRGSHELGAFEQPVMDLIEREYPRLLDWYRRDNFIGDIVRRGASLLFEYVGPANQIVIKYDKPRLYLIGMVWHSNLDPSWDAAELAVISKETGVPLAPRYTFDVSSPEVVLNIVRDWTDVEGIVAGFVGSLDGITNTRRLLKIKTSQYVRLHGIKFKLEGKVDRLAFLLGIKSAEDVLPGLAEIGVDYEAQQFIMPEMDAYLAKRAAFAKQWENFAFHADQTRQQGVAFGKGKAETRRWFVACIELFILLHKLPQSFFGAAMKIYDEKPDEAALIAYADQVMGVPVNVLKGWLKNPKLAIGDIMSAPVVED